MCLLIYDINTCNGRSQPTLTYSIMSFPGKMYLSEINNRNTRKKAEMHSKLIIKTPEQCQ